MEVKKPDVIIEDYVCRTCKSNDLLHEGMLEWDIDTQKMEFTGNLTGEFYCKICDDWSKHKDTVLYKVRREVI
jgi:hypothetical protein